MSNTFDTDRLLSGTVYDSSGDKVGKVGQVYLDDRSGEPNWVTVNTGLLGTSESFVPLRGARAEGDDIHVPYTKSFIKDAPNVDEDGHIDEGEEQQLYDYYSKDEGFSTRERDAGQGVTDRDRDVADAGTAGTAGVGAAGVAGAAGDRDVDRGVGDRDVDRGVGDRDVDRGVGDRDVDRGVGDRERVADTGDDSVVRREEEVRVGTRREETGRARLRKHVVTEQQTVNVPVEREEVEVVREPIADGEGSRGGSLEEGEASVTLHEERPVVEKEVVDKERIGLDKRAVTEEQQVTTDVSREEVDVDTGRTGDVGRDDVGRDNEGLGRDDRR